MDRSDVIVPLHLVSQAAAGAVDGVVRRLVRYDHLGDAGAIEGLATTTRAAAERANCDAMLTVALECRAQADLNSARYPEALRGYAESLRRWQALGDRAGEARSRISYARTLDNCGLTSEALDQAYAALRLADDAMPATVHIGALLMIGRVQTGLRMWDEAGRFIERALVAARSSADPFEIGRALCDRGYYLCERSREARARGDRDGLRIFALEAEACNREGGAICRETRQRSLILVLQLNLGECLMDLDRLDEAALAVEEVHVAAKASSPPSPYYHAEALITLAQIRLASARHDDAIAHLAEATVIATHHGMNALVMKCHELLANATEERGDFRTALHHHRRFFDAHNAVQSEAAKLRSSVLAVQMEIVEARAAVMTERKRAEDLESSNRQLARESLEDPLTGLANRRSFARAFERVADQHTANGEQFFVAVVDVDDFKQVNDTYSHSIGDDVLRKIANLIRAENRVDDVVARYGGEEFVLLMQNTARAGAMAVCERICGAVAAWPWDTMVEGLQVTISVGVAGSWECVDRTALFDLADRRLYVAKGNGKNQVVADVL